MENLTTAEFKEKIFDYTQSNNFKLKSNKPVILDFSAHWCSPCQMVTPILEQLSKEYADKIDIYKIDVDSEYEVSQAFGIRSIPSILFAPVNGDPQMMSGALPKKVFEKAINEIFNVSNGAKDLNEDK